MSLRWPAGRPAALASAVVAALAAASCGTADSVAPRGTPGLRVISGETAQDSAFAIVTTPLVIEVRDSTGALAKPGTPVRFESLSHEVGYIPDVGFLGIPELFVRATGEQDFYFIPHEWPTDALGRLVMQVRLGVRAGVARLRISSPAFAGSDTLRYTVVAANPNGMVLTPADTTIRVGATVAFHAAVVDRGGNPRADPVSWSIEPNSIEISSSGVVSATRAGQYFVTATAVPLGVPGNSTRFTVLP